MSSPLKRKHCNDQADGDVDEEGSPTKRQRLLPLDRSFGSGAVIDIDVTKSHVKDDDDENGYSTNDNWDREERVRLFLGDYNRYKAGIIGSAQWNEEQNKLHKLIYMRGEHPMLAFSWRYNFKIWGVDPEVYSKENSMKKLAISALTSEFKAAKALEDLFNLSLQVKQRIDIDAQDNIPRTIVKVLKRYIAWAKRDAGVSNKDFPPVVMVRAYPLDFTGEKIKIKVEEESVTMSDFPSTPEASSTVAASTRYGEEGGNEDSREGKNGEEGEGAIAKDIEKRLRDLATRQRKLYKAKASEGQTQARPPVLYAFAVVAHVCMLVSLDSATEDGPLIVLDTIHFERVDQWLWNALSVALPINFARDSMYARRDLWGDLGGSSVDVDR